MLLKKSHSENAKAIGFMVFGMLGFAGMDALGKWIMGTDHSAFQLIAIKSWIVIVTMAIWIFVTGRLSQLKTNRPGSHVVRILLSFSGPILMLIALAQMPLADVTVIVFSSVFITTALSFPVFKEKVGLHRWLAVVFGFVGVIIALKPGMEVFQPAGILALLAGAAFATINLTTRWLKNTETEISLIFYTILGMAMLSSLMLPFVWKPMSFFDFSVYSLMGVFTLIGYIGVTKAFMRAPLGVVAPFEYTLMLFAVVSGYFIWGDLPDVSIWTGAAIIVASGLYLIYRETREIDGFRAENN